MALKKKKKKSIYSIALITLYTFSIRTLMPLKKILLNIWFISHTFNMISCILMVFLSIYLKTTIIWPSEGLHFLFLFVNILQPLFALISSKYQGPNNQTHTLFYIEEWERQKSTKNIFMDLWAGWERYPVEKWTEDQCGHCDKLGTVKTKKKKAFQTWV